jgi:hypothetical protein
MARACLALVFACPIHIKASKSQSDRRSLVYENVTIKANLELESTLNIHSPLQQPERTGLTAQA